MVITHIWVYIYIIYIIYIYIWELLGPLSSFRFTDELFAYSKNLFSSILIHFFDLYKNHPKKTEIPETITPQGISKNTHGHHFSTQNSTWMMTQIWEVEDKVGDSQKIKVGNITGMDKKLPRNTFSLIWGYHYRFRRGQNPIGKNQDTYYNLEMKHVPFFWTCICYYIRPDAVQYRTALFSPARLFSGRSGFHEACLLQHPFSAWNLYQTSMWVVGGVCGFCKSQRGLLQDLC